MDIQAVIVVLTAILLIWIVPRRRY